MKPHLFICLSCLLLSGASASRAASPAPDYPMQVILDTDLGNDIDDLLALQMLINYEKAGKIALQGISLSKANVHAFELARQYYEAYGTGHPAFGYMSHGPNPDDGHYLTATLAALGTDTLPPAESHEAVDMLRRQLAASADSSIVMIAIGPLTNLAQLLHSEADSLSPLPGIELARRKVKLLCLMGGDYRSGAAPEWNVMQDRNAASTVFERWPTRLVASGFEVGGAILFPHERITGDFHERHPLRVGYEHFLDMPYDRPCWDLTAVLHAVEADSAWFGLSGHGHIGVDSTGRTRFSADAAGKHRYLTLRSDTVAAVLADRVRPVGKTNNP